MILILVTRFMGNNWLNVVQKTLGSPSKNSGGKEKEKKKKKTRVELQSFLRYIQTQKSKVCENRTKKLFNQRVFPIFGNSLLTRKSLIGKTQKFDFHINMFLYFEVRYIQSKLCWLHLILSSFVISMIQTWSKFYKIKICHVSIKK